MPPKVKGRTTETIKEMMAEEGYNLLSEYTLTGCKLTVRCPKGHKTTTTYHRWLYGHRCRYCANESKYVSYSQTDVEDYFQKYECTLLSEYTGNQNDILRFQCKCGNCDNITFKAYRRKPENNKLCVRCNRRRLSETELENLFSKYGCTYISQDPANSEYHIYICSCGNTAKISTSFLKRGRKCLACGRKSRLKAEKRKSISA